MIPIVDTNAIRWKEEDLSKLKEAYKLTLRKERLLLNQGQLNYLEKKEVGDIKQEVQEFDGLIARITEEVIKSNPLMYIEPLSNGKLSTIRFQDLQALLAEKANEDIDYWPSHFSSRKEYMTWLSSQ